MYDLRIRLSTARALASLVTLPRYVAVSLIEKWANEEEDDNNEGKSQVPGDEGCGSDGPIVHSYSPNYAYS